MGLFSKKKKKDGKKQEAGQTVKVDSDKKIDKPKQPSSTEVPAGKSMKELYAKEKPDKPKKITDDKSAKKGEIKTRKYSQAYRILIKPLVTEKVSTLGAENKYVFQIAKDANKIEVAKAIIEVYGIKPINVNIINVRGKKIRYGRKTGRRKNWKKAIIALPEGKSINVYEGV